MNDDPSSPFFYLNIKKQAEDLGFTIYPKQAQDFIDNIDSAWLKGCFNFFDYVAEGVREKFPDLPQNEQTALFVDSWQKDFLIDNFPEWRKAKVAESVAREKRRRQEAEEQDNQRRLSAFKNNKPTICKNCGGKLPVIEGLRGSCSSCGWEIYFSENSGAWELCERQSFSDAFKKIAREKCITEEGAA